MQQTKLLSLNLKNFKGVPSFSLVVNGANAKVFGDNATGKTTLFDSFIWLLFDKDSNNKKDFSLKTLDAVGKELHMLEHEVEGAFSINGTHKTFRKVYSEQWIKKRGSATEEFTGHTTKYYVDGVPSKKNEYTKEIESIVSEDIFKLLTSPSYFNEQLKWQDRRKILLEICGDITEDEVCASDKNLSKLPEILNGRTIENHRKIIAARRSEINKELEKIPVRIDEIKRSQPTVDGMDKHQLESQISSIQLEIDEKMNLISNIRNGKAIAEKQMLLTEIEAQLLQIKRDHESNSKEKTYQLKAKVQEEHSNVSILTSKLENIKNQKRFNDDNIKSIDNQLAQLRQKWHEVNEGVFTHTDARECPTCGQALPQEQVEETKSKALAQFNLKKSEELEKISGDGKRNSERKHQFEQDNENLAKEYEKLNVQINDKQEALAKVQEQLRQLESTITDVLENQEYVAKLQVKQQVNTEIQQLRNSAEQSIQDVQMEIVSLKSNRDALQLEVGKFSLVTQSKKRIEELETQQRDLAAEFEKLEMELYLTEEFIRAKVNMLEEKINSKFKYARFKLFETQINGGLQEVCETLYEGVPYSSGLNNAAKINVGLDIINTLSEYYGFSAPIFIDNSEAVTRLIPTHSQTISLVVSEPDKQLRVEVDGDKFHELLTVDNEVI
jgi:DNA repair exonuclease SbcCD ATPase subunit